MNPIVIVLVLAGAFEATDASGAESAAPARAPAWAAVDDPDNPFGFGTWDTTEVAPGVYSFRYGYTRNLFVVTDEGVIATDPIGVEEARLMREAIRAVTPLPVRYVVYSHQHWDHVLGGAIFREEGARFVSHANCVPHFERMPHPDLVMPDIVFEGDYTLELGGRRLELIYLGLNHGDCTVVMRPDSSRLLFIVDLVTAGRTPLGAMPDYYPLEWIESLRAIEAMDFDVFVGGHGPALAPKAAVAERRRYLEALVAAVKRELDAGTSWREVPERVRLPAFEHLGGIEYNLPRNAERIVSMYTMGW